MLHHATILMADMVGSSRSKQPAAVMARFKELVAAVNSDPAIKVRSPLTITLGDEFQGVLGTPADGVRAILALEERIRQGAPAFTLRYVLHQGRIDTPLVTERAHGMLGPGLTWAREALEALKDSRDERFRFALRDAVMSDRLNASFFLYQELVDAWKERDHELVAAFLRNDNYRAVAEVLGRDPSLMWRRRRSLRMPAYTALRRLVLSLTNGSPA